MDAQDLQRLREIAHLIGSIYFYGDFKAETRNEVELQKRLEQAGCFYQSEDEVIQGGVAIDKAAERAVSPAESVQSVDFYDKKLLELLWRWAETHMKRGYTNDDQADAHASLADFLNAAVTAQEKIAHAEGRRSAMEELHPQWLKEKERADEAERVLKVVQQKNIELARQCDGVLALEIELAALRAAQQTAEPVAMTDVLAAIRTVDKEAERRGGMFPQDADEHRADRRAVQRVLGMLKWYGDRQECEKWKEWPRRAAPPQQAAPMTPEMLRAVQLRSEVGTYITANWANAYDCLQELWRVACEAQAKQQVDTGGLPG